MQNNCKITLTYTTYSGFNDPDLIDRINGSIRNKLISVIHTYHNPMTETIDLTLEFASVDLKNQWLLFQHESVKRLIHE